MLAALPGPLLLVFAAVLLGAEFARVGFRARTDARADWVAAMIVFAAGLALRLGFGLWGPLHVNGQGPLWIRGALSLHALEGYGPGYFELFHWVTGLGERPDLAVFAANAVLSSATPALVYATARVLDAPRASALVAAVALACDPVSVRTAATENYIAPLVALVALAQLSLALATRAAHRGERTSAALGLVAAAATASAATRIHPMVYLPVAMLPLICLAGTPEPSPLNRRTLAFTALAAAAVGLGVVATSGELVVRVLEGSTRAREAPPRLALVDALWLVASGIALFAVGVRTAARPIALGLVGLAALGALVATEHGFGQHPFWQLGYQRLYVASMALGAIAFVAPLARSAVHGVAIGATCALAMGWPARTHLSARTTEQLEYAFLARELPKMPAGCRLHAVERVGHRVWVAPEYLVPESRRAGGSACQLVVRSSLCSSRDGRPACEALEANLALDLLASVTLPAAPSYVGLPYDTSQVVVSIFRAPDDAELAPGGAVARGTDITPALAQRVFAALTALHEDDGCVVTNVTTDRDRMRIRVVGRDGATLAVEAARPRPGADLLLGRADDLAVRCPTTSTRMRAGLAAASR